MSEIINSESSPYTFPIAMATENTATRQNVEDNIVCHMTESFLGKVTTEQVELLISGIPDVSTKILLTELTLELIASLTSMFLRQEDIEQCDLSKLEDTLVESFSDALGIEMTDNVSIRQFSKMIQKEVTKNIKSIQSTGENNIIGPERLNNISSCVLEIFQTFASKLMFAVTFPKQNQSQDMEDLSFKTNLGSSDSKQDNGPSEQRIKLTSKITSSPTDMTATEIICCLIDEIPGDAFKKVMEETSRELLSIDEQFTRFVFNTEKNKESFAKVEPKFKEYFTMCFTKAWANHLLDKMTWMDQKETAQHIDLPHSLINFVQCHLQNDAEEGADKEHSRSTFENSSEKQLLMFTSEFSQFLYNMVKQQRSYYATSEVELYDDIRGKVWIFTVLLNWWVNNQMSKVTERMNLAYVDEGIQQCDSLLTEHRKVRFIFILVEKVVLNLYDTLKIMPTNVDKVIKHVFQKVMDEVQETDLYFRDKSFKIYKKINIALLKRFGSPEAVLFLLNTKDPAIEECIIAVLRQKMMKPAKKQNVIRRFFSSFWKIICVKSAKFGCLSSPPEMETQEEECI